MAQLKLDGQLGLRFRMLRPFTCAVAGLAFVAGGLAESSCSAEDWLHWRGPTGNGTAIEAKPPTEWGQDKNIKWKVPVPGKGSGSPIVVGDRVFVVSAVSGQQTVNGGPAAEQRGSPGDRSRGGRRGRGGAPLTQLDFKVYCYNRGNGSLIWEKTAVSGKPHEGTHSTNTFASASPTSDGKHLYAHFGSRGLFCYTLDGELKWKRDFGDMQTRATFGEGSSPTIVGDLIIVPWDHEGPSALYALNKMTGETVWEAKRDEPTNWSTPLIVEHEGKQQVVLNGQNFARAYDLESGKELWRCDGQTQRPVASAVADNGLVFVGSGFRGSFMGAFRLGGSGDIEGSSNVAWTIGEDTPDIASPLLSGGRLYFHKGKSGILSCVDAQSGEFLFKSQRLGRLGSIYASPVAAGGHIYLSDRAGLTVVIKDAGQLEIVASNDLGETIDATPAPAGEELFIRGSQYLFCIAE
ncbi:MAG: PQQ-binding-like beta-propeller repeat protein [Aureliella sp.]